MNIPKVNVPPGTLPEVIGGVLGQKMSIDMGRAKQQQFQLCFLVSDNIILTPFQEMIKKVKYT